MKKFLLLCLNIGFIMPIAAARPILTKEKWAQMQKERAAQYGSQDEMKPETRPILIEDVEDEEEIAQTPPPLPPRPKSQRPPLPPRPVLPQPTTAGSTTKSSLPFTSQDLSAQAGKLKKPAPVTKAPAKEALPFFKEQLEARFKGAIGSDDESETEAWEWED